MYVILEMQTTGDSTAIVPPVSKKDRNEAESVFYQTLAAAAISKVPVHAVSLLRDDGTLVKSECYVHGGEEE